MSIVAVFLSEVCLEFDKMVYVRSPSVIFTIFPLPFRSLGDMNSQTERRGGGGDHKDNRLLHVRLVTTSFLHEDGRVRAEAHKANVHEEAVKKPK